MPDKEGFGFLYPNKDRQGAQPNVTGHVIIGGRTVELAGWTKTSKNGVRYISLKGQDKGEAETDDFAPTAQDDDDIPF